MGRSSTPVSLIGGVHAVMAALQGRRPVYRVWRLASATRDNDALEQELAAHGLSAEPIERSELDRRLPNIAHQGVAAEIAAPEAIDEQALAETIALAGSTSLVLALDQIQDPHNLGACLRSAAAAGVDAVIAPRRQAVGLTSSAIKVAAGGAEYVPFARVTNLARTLTWLQDAGYFSTGLEGEAPSSIDTLDLGGRHVIVAGGEADGLRRRTTDCCDRLGSIPLCGSIESLNVSVAVGVALFEARRQQRQGG
ncbi:23S rRNA (guanosine(2251)-2'-O)-methyltransferase RlmB [Salinisphaera sp. USBA-960]|nr:23S rRNA (guanosine(2251)-2'-O)-methyltransferase RlmB [Salifodinibacter halophilus]NNC26265.1 23S rRNA (guanosine(2251)-2'-O)-methyltransferase RlmB [Salifodinibacter halophilus]